MNKINPWYAYGYLRGFNGPTSRKERQRAIDAIVLSGSRWTAYNALVDCELQESQKLQLERFIKS